MKDGLYHKDVYMPEISFEIADKKLNYSSHAIEQSRYDRYGEFSLPVSIKPQFKELIELEVRGGVPYKGLFRLHYNSQFVICLAVIFESLVVKTVWLNRKSDNHRTLDRSLYLTKKQSCGKI